MERIDARIERLAKISETTNRHIDRFVEATAQQIDGIKNILLNYSVRLNIF